MSEIVVTLVLLGTVIAGGLFVFWPELFSLVTKPVEIKKKTLKRESADSIYRKHYTEEDQLIEAVTQKEQYGTSMQDAEHFIEQRREIIRKLIQEERARLDCNICGRDLVKTSNEFLVRCTCNNGQFKKKVEAMLQETGHRKY